MSRPPSSGASHDRLMADVPSGVAVRFVGVAGTLSSGRKSTTDSMEARRRGQLELMNVRSLGPKVQAYWTPPVMREAIRATRLAMDEQLVMLWELPSGLAIPGGRGSVLQSLVDAG